MEAAPIKMAERTVQACVFVKMKFLVELRSIRFSNSRLKRSFVLAEGLVKRAGHAR
jgi:hypothetical protein